MTPARLWWVRHAPTHARAMIGWTDAPADLSDTGALARLAAALPAAAPVISSDLVRAQATAEAIADGRDRLPPDPRLREIHFGDWEGRSFAEVQAEAPARIRAFWDRPGEISAPGGESWDVFSARVCAAADALAARGGDIVVVAHFGAILTQVERALALPTVDVFAHRIENLSITRIAFDGQGWQAGPINQRP